MATLTMMSLLDLANVLQCTLSLYLKVNLTVEIEEAVGIHYG